MMNIPYGKQQITTEDVAAVSKALVDDFLTQGPLIPQFEQKFAEYVGSTYAVAVSNGTAALHLSALTLKVQPGDKVITTALTFAASANCIRYCGGEVVFVDIDPDTLLIDLNQVEALLSAAPRGTYKGLIPVDFAGRAVDLEQCKKLAAAYHLWILEDACHAPGGHFVDANGKNQTCGNGQFADLAIFSLHPVKHIAAGEGGVITTNDKTLYDQLQKLRTHGITKKEGDFTNSIGQVGGHPSSGAYPGWYMEMQQLGFNYRITDFQCALAMSQLSRASEGLKIRRTIAKKYDEAFHEHPNITAKGLEMTQDLADKHAYHLYVIEVEQRLELYEYLRVKGIFAQVHYYPLHLMPYYRAFGWKEGDLPVVEAYYQRCLSIPMYPSLLAEEQHFVIQSILAFYD
jgi:UDP-4-amino-4,6-dideoxy-N-acetyl-beta-L-altrosamine transaminase